jgi:hypothetical protein
MYGNKLKRFSRYLRRTIAVLISANLICSLFGCSSALPGDPSNQDVSKALKDIWEIESHNALIIELDNYVSAKCDTVRIWIECHLQKESSTCARL